MNSEWIKIGKAFIGIFLIFFLHITYGISFFSIGDFIQDMCQTSNEQLTFGIPVILSIIYGVIASLAIYLYRYDYEYKCRFLILYGVWIGISLIEVFIYWASIYCFHVGYLHWWFWFLAYKFFFLGPTIFYCVLPMIVMRYIDRKKSENFKLKHNAL